MFQAGGDGKALMRAQSPAPSGSLSRQKSTMAAESDAQPCAGGSSSCHCRAACQSPGEFCNRQIRFEIDDEVAGFCSRMRFYNVRTEA
jgi:hypothetical protein